jgi:uncharacterized Zn finger protein (UPF0148 family)
MGEVNCGNCGAPVKGEPGPMACPYCGTDIHIPGAPKRDAANEIVQTEHARRHDRYEEDDEPVRQTESSSASSAPIIIAVVAVLGVIAALSFVATKSRAKKTSTKAERSKTTATATTTTTVKKATPPPAYVENVAIPSCRCAFGDGQSTPLVTLALRAAPLMDPSRPFDVRIERKSGFVTETRSAVLSMTNANALSPDDAGALPAHLAVACDPGIYVLVADKTASGWSSVDAKWKWTTVLPATEMDGADASAPLPPNGAGFAPYCTALPTQSGNATLTLANGRKATLSLKDGKLR